MKRNRQSEDARVEELKADDAYVRSPPPEIELGAGGNERLQKSGVDDEVEHGKIAPARREEDAGFRLRSGRGEHWAPRARGRASCYINRRLRDRLTGSGCCESEIQGTKSEERSTKAFAFFRSSLFALRSSYFAFVFVRPPAFLLEAPTEARSHSKARRATGTMGLSATTISWTRPLSEAQGAKVGSEIACLACALLSFYAAAIGHF